MNSIPRSIASPARARIAGPEERTEETMTTTPSIEAAFSCAIVQPTDLFQRTPGDRPVQPIASATKPTPNLLLRPVFRKHRPTRR